MQHKVFFATVFLGFFVLVSIGCGNPDSNFVKVEGTVSYNGTPVDGAIITFMPVDQSGTSGSGGTDASGRYTLNSPGAAREGSGVLPGEYTVLIQKEEVTSILGPDTIALQQGQITEEDYRKRMDAKGIDSDSRTEVKDLLPVKYRRANLSPLKVTVDKGNSKHDFELTD